MRNLTFKAAMWKSSRPTVNRQSTDGQSQRHCKQTPLTKRWKVLMTLVFLFTLGIGNVWGADETIFSASCKVSSDVTVNSETTDQSITSSQADIAGGSMYVSNGESDNKKLLLANAGPSGDKKAAFTITNGKTIFKIVLNKSLAAGDVISASFYVGSDKTGMDGLWFSTSSSRPGSEPTTKAGVDTPSGWNDVTYTVATGDGICGESTIYVHRATSTSTYFPSITITRSSGGDEPGGDTEAPTLSSSTPANEATDVAVSGNIVLTFDEAIASVDASKFTLTGATKGTVTIDGTDAKKVNVGYTAENNASVTLAVAADAVADAAGNKSAALSNISFTTAAGTSYPEGYIYITDVMATPETGASATASSMNGYNTNLNSNFDKGNFTGTKYAITSSSSGYYTLTFSPALDVSTYSNLKLDVWWGSNGTGSNSGIKVNVNGTEVYSAATSQSTRNKIQTGLDRVITATSISTIQLKGNNNSGTVFFRVGIKGESTPSCSAPTSPTISGDASYTEGETITLTASHEGTNHSATTTYQWFKGATFATATSVQAAATGATGYTFSKTAALSDDGSVYWCEAANGTCKSHNETGKTIAVSASSAPTHAISYNEESLKGQSVSGYPTEYTEGVGIASFDDLADVTNFHFNGWSPASISASATTDQTISATWVAAYNVSFNAGAGGGTVPTSFQKWQGAKFNLPGQGSMTAPSGKVFDGWKASGTKYAENAEYTMGNAAVEFVAQWKAVPQTIYSLTVTNTSSVNLNNGGTQDDLADDATIVGGGAYMQNDHANNAQRILESTKLQFKAGTVTLAMTLNTALKEGDTIKATGLNSEGLCFGVTFDRAGNLNNQLASDASYFIVPEEFEGKTTLYAWRHSGSGTTCASIIIRRPADRPISSTEISLSDLKVNNRSIHSDSLAMLKTGPAYSLHLGDEFVVAPVIKFNRHKVITFADSEEPTQAIYDRAYSVTATTVSGQWQAAQEINDITYTVTATKITSYTVAYKDENGTTSLGSEVVAVGEYPTASGITAKKAYHSFAGWTLGGNPVELTGVSAEAGETVTLVASYTPAYATSVNIEQWVLDNSKNNTAFRAVLNERHYTYSNLNDLDSLTTAKNETDRNEPYLGQKWKKNDSEISFLLKSGSTVRVKFGYVGDNVNIKIGSADPISNTSTQLENPYEYTATEDVVIKLQGTGTETVVVKQIMIDEEIATVKLHAIVTYDAGTGSYGKANEKYTGTPLVIGDATPVTDSIFAGWYLGDDQIDATAYVPTKNVTLQAHYAPQEYTINYNAGDHGQTAIVAASAGWGTEYTAIANPFTPEEGYIFTGWAVTGVDGVSTIAAGGSFTMPKNEVTLTAQWEDNSKVAQIVETSAKYTSFAAAIDAVQADQTIQLLQDCEYDTYWNLTIADTVTLDLNGKNLTYTGSLRGVQVSNGGTLILMDGIATVAPTIDLTTNPMARTAITYTSGTFDSKDGMCALAGSEIVINSGRYLATEGVILVKGLAATATVNDGVLICRDNFVVGGNGTNSADFRNYVMNIHGGILYGEIFSAGYASMVVYHPNVGELNIDGGILVSTNGPCVVTRGGASNITGGTLVALGSGSGKCGDASLVLPAVGVACDFKSAYPGVASTNVAISGTVDVTGEAGAVQAVYKAAEPTAAEVEAIGVSGGTFNTELTNEVCAPGFVPAPQDPVTGKFSVEPKDGVSIIKAVATATSQDITGDKLTGLYKGAAHIYTANNYKLDTKRYFMVQLEEGKNFQAGDIVKINVSAVNDATGFAIYSNINSSDDFSDEDLIIDTHENSSTAAKVSEGINEVELPSSYLGSNKLYVARASSGDHSDKYLNAGINQVEVVRVIYPTLTAITFNDVAATKGTGNAFSVTLPEEGTNLASMTVVPTIIRNAAHATTPEAVVSNEGTWVAGDNTYRVMDKDGDYTDYTITITLQGNAKTPSITVQPLTQAYCAGSEPTLSVTASVTEGTLHYAWFKEAGETDEAVGEDQATYTVAGAGTYYVIVTNKVTGKLDASITSDNAVITQNTAAAITTQPTAHNDVVSGTEITLSVTATNATGYQWYICDDADKTNASAISGAEAASYVFTCTASAYYYCVVGNACGDDLTSNVVAVKLEPEGCNTFASEPAAAPYNYEQTGEWTFYNVDSNGADKSEDNNVFEDGKNFDDEDVVVANTRRFALKFEKDVESVTLYGVGGSDKSFTHVSVADAMEKNTYTQLTTTATKTDVTDKNHIFTVDNVIIPADKYAWFEFSGSLKFFKICYTAAIEKPVIATQPATKIDFAAGDMTATVVVNAVTEGTLKYQWYNADGDVAVDGATSATLTTTTEGTYYVIVRNTLAGHKDYAVKSDEATLAYRQMNDATLSALSVSAGALDPTFDKAVVEYRVDLPKGTTTVPTLTATATMAAYGATAVVTNAAEFENYEAVSTVLVTAEDHTTQKTYTVHYYVAHSITTLVDVTENTTWDWSLVTKKADGTTISGDGPKLDESEDGLILASYLSGDDFDKLEGNNGAYAIRNGSDKKVYQGASLRMHTTKGGYLKIKAANEGHAMTLNVQNAGRDMEIATLTGSQVEYTVYVQAGDVRIYNVSSESKPMRVSKIVFTVDETPDYTRDQMLGAGVYGTICLPYNVPAGGAFGATFYEMAGRNPENGKIVMDEVTALEAGVPYVFEAHGDIINVFYGETHVDDPIAHKGMYGTFVDQTLTELDGIYYFAQRALWGCADLTSLTFPANRAYVKLAEVNYIEPNSAPAPGRRRITFGVNGEQTATGIDALNAEDVPVKMMIDGKLFILRGEKMYDATGKLVK